MAGQFEAVIEVERPIAEVFAYLADGRNDPEFSPRVLEISKDPDGPTAPGTVFTSTVKDAGMRTRRQIRITALDAPTTLRWTEVSRNLVTSSVGGYDLTPLTGTTTRVRIFNSLEGHGFGRLLVGVALSAARKDAPAFGRRIKAAVEAS
ncbi:SRPBCC family protein [Streptomyces sp. CB01881]|uniref:SRPBCC family protein n=1 Tax=Streptomyces sp. CB01881 TaxID=2078691 RepID=UPI000CDC8B78|nr:SRPBCC family protein [Streptomyces sp. CB01881]AUY47719.1 polyketide cyclase [Streptomyces sp. CB01881]TYC76194.1 polyketide cyclase [Streptomyces sp. CB01881]